MSILTPPAGEDDPLFRFSLIGLVADSLGIIAAIWELADDILYLSEHWSVINGGPGEPTYTTSRQFRTLVHPHDQPAFDAAIGRCLETSAGMVEAMIRVRLKPDDWQWMEARFRLAQRDESGRASRLMATMVARSEREPGDKPRPAGLAAG
ncbi:MAG: Signal transduction histidine-protein kinase BarA [Herminiimonas sp.]|jgi:hypothetical protein|nr:Signal transduction histidine-protein kinase BarA [Herminiimonas sp.]